MVNYAQIEKQDAILRNPYRDFNEAQFENSQLH